MRSAAHRRQRAQPARPSQPCACKVPEPVAKRYTAARHGPRARAPAPARNATRCMKRCIKQREVSMRKILLGLAAAGCFAPPVFAQAQDNNPKPTCNMCPGTYIPVEELQAYTKKA